MSSIISRLMERPLVDDPFPLYHELRSSDPVHREPNGVWYLTRYADVEALFMSPHVRQGAHHAPDEHAEPSTRDRIVSLMFSSYDPPVHGVKRGVVAPHFTSAAANGWAVRVGELTEQLLDELDAAGEFDLDGAYAARLPVIVTCEMLGIPFEDRAQCVAWVDQLTSANQPVQQPGMRAAGSQAAESLVEYFGALLQKADHSDASGSVIQTLSAACETGAMDLEEVVATLVLLMAAGFETTRYTITGGIIALIENPEQWALAQQQVDANGTISSTAVEEMLRHQGPIHGALPRVGVEPLRFGDVSIPAGEPVVAMVAAASRDPAAYEDPDALRIDRRGPKALGFGAGPHYCLGFALAKHEVNHAISTVLRRFPRLRIVEPPGTKGSFNVRGPAGLRVAAS